MTVGFQAGQEHKLNFFLKDLSDLCVESRPERGEGMMGGGSKGTRGEATAVVQAIDSGDWDLGSDGRNGAKGPDE